MVKPHQLDLFSSNKANSESVQYILGCLCCHRLRRSLSLFCRISYCILDWPSGIGGLSFIGIGIGVLIVIACEPFLRKLINSHRKDPETGKVLPEAMASVVILGAIMLAIGQLWFAWTCTPNVHWIVPIISGVPFGAGNACVFIYSTNYMAHSYDMYTASAMSGNMFSRSIMGACLPLAGLSMYKALGLNWASTLLGLVEIACISIPVVFYIYGHRIRKASPMIQELESMKYNQ